MWESGRILLPEGASVVNLHIYAYYLYNIYLWWCRRRLISLAAGDGGGGGLRAAAKKRPAATAASAGGEEGGLRICAEGVEQMDI